MNRALAIVNQKYNGNIEFNRFSHEGNGFRFTLRVINSRLPGARLGFTGKHLINACWHVHGNFFDALLNIYGHAKIKTAKRTIEKTAEGQIIGNWEDWNIGSIMEPLYYSEACNCGSGF